MFYPCLSQSSPKHYEIRLFSRWENFILQMRKLRLKAPYSAIYIYCLVSSLQWMFGTIVILTQRIRKLMFAVLNCLIPCLNLNYIYYKTYSNGSEMFMCSFLLWHCEFKDIDSLSISNYVSNKYPIVLVLNCECSPVNK